MTENKSQRVALITGASSGVGLATAKRLIEEGVFVVIATREGSLWKFSQQSFLRDPSRFLIRALDINDASARFYLIEEIKKKLGRLDILVNAAEVMYRNPIESSNENEIQHEMMVNFHSPLALIKLCVPLMREAGGGHIINISSILNLLSVPTAGIHVASRQALEAVSEVLFYELRPWNIHVSLILPGFTPTNNSNRSSDHFTPKVLNIQTSEIYAHYGRAVTGLMDWARKLGWSSSERTARSIWDILQMSSPPLRQRVGFDAHTIFYLKYLLPEAIFYRLVNYCLIKIGSTMEQIHCEHRAKVLVQYEGIERLRYLR